MPGKQMLCCILISIISEGDMKTVSYTHLTLPTTPYV